MDEEEPTSAADDGPGSPAGDATAAPGAATAIDRATASAAADGQGPPAGDGTGGPLDRSTLDEGLTSAGRGGRAAGAGIDSLPWDDDLPLALGDETDAAASSPVVHADSAEARADPDGADDLLDADTDTDADTDSDVFVDPYDDLDDLSQDPVGGRRNALPRRVETWRSRSATGAIATAIAMGLQQVFEPEKRRPAIVAEAPSDPYDDDDPVTVDYVPDDAEGTKVHVKPWLLQKGDPT